MNPPEVKNLLEFALLAAGGPLDMADFRRLLDGEDGDIKGALAALEKEWEGRGLRLAKVADGWQLISRGGYLEYLRRLRPKKPARLSRQLMESLAVIAYRQPATRGDIEQVRGVSVSSVQLAALEEFGWIEEVGRRETPGRPILYGTTKTFLNDLAIASLDELPELEPEDINAGFEDAEESRASADDPPPRESGHESEREFGNTSGDGGGNESESETESPDDKSGGDV
ncbi:MAG: SMC-Scp complex subunit ScpB [Gammaproteobacteria bacterium]